MVKKDLDGLNKIKNVKEKLIAKIDKYFGKLVNTSLEIDSFFPQISGSKLIELINKTNKSCYYLNTKNINEIINKNSTYNIVIEITNNIGAQIIKKLN